MSTTITVREAEHDGRLATHSRLFWTVADALVLAKRHLVRMPRIPEEIVFATIQPVMFVLLFRYVFGGAIATPGMSYVDFLMPGIFVQTLVFGSTSTGIGLAQDMEKGLIDRFRSLPMAQSAVLAGRIIADLVRNLFVALVMLVVGLLVGYRPDTALFGWLGILFMMMLLSFTFSWVGAVIALSVRSVEAAQSAGFIWLFPLTFASSAFAPTQSMPGWLQAFADHQPITLMVNAIRAISLGQPAAVDSWQAIGWCAGILLVSVPVAIRVYNRRTAR